MPIARLAVVFVAVKEKVAPMYGTRTARSCSACGRVQPPKREKSWRGLYVFGLPLFTWRREVTERCSGCSAVLRKAPATFVQSALWYLS